jgi:dTDP-glucose 4,6-dehydratase
MTSGLQTREFNYITDIGDGIIASSTEAAVGQIINIGGGEELSIIDVVRRIYTLCGSDLSLIRTGALETRSGEVSRFYGEHSKASSLLGHTPKIDLDEGLRATIAWWRDQ